MGFEFILAIAVIASVTVVKVIIAHHNHKKAEKKKAAQEAQIEDDDPAEIEVETMTIEVDGVKTTYTGLKINTSNAAAAPPEVKESDDIATAIMDGLGGALSTAGVPFAEVMNGISSAAGQLVNYVHKKFTKHTEVSSANSHEAIDNKSGGFFSNLYSKAKCFLGFGSKDSDQKSSAADSSRDAALEEDAVSGDYENEDLDGIDENSKMLLPEQAASPACGNDSVCPTSNACEANVAPVVLGACAIEVGAAG